MSGMSESPSYQDSRYEDMKAKVHLLFRDLISLTHSNHEMRVYRNNLGKVGSTKQPLGLLPHRYDCLLYLRNLCCCMG